jgi:tocopherol cyclase
MLSIKKPSNLQGNFDRIKYFEGWFHKIYSAKYNASFILIYGYATGNSTNKFGFIQVHIPNQQPLVMYFNKNEIICDSNQHSVQMGEHIFTTNKIDINTKEIGIQLHLNDNQPINTFKNSMGYNYVIPNLPCYHAILNKSHNVSGEIRAGDTSFVMNQEKGYLEKNWGTSFPDNYIWLHAVDPTNSDVNLLFSQAEIKWMGQTFLRHLGYLNFENECIDFRQLKNAVVSNSSISPVKQLIRISSKLIELDISIILGQQIIFKGPEDGALRRDIVHFTDAFIEIKLKRNSETKKFSLVGNFENVRVTYG